MGRIHLAHFYSEKLKQHKKEKKNKNYKKLKKIMTINKL